MTAATRARARGRPSWRAAKSAAIFNACVAGAEKSCGTRILRKSLLIAVSNYLEPIPSNFPAK